MRGFSLIELFIVISILVVVFLASLPFYNYFSTFSVLDSVKQETLQNVRLAQNKAQSGENGSDFGVKFETSQYTLYQGSSFVGHPTSQDMIFALPTNVQIINPPEVNFSSKTGLPKAGVVITILNIPNNKSETITVNLNGLIY